MSKKIEELKQQYPELWERACKKFESEKGREKYFLALIEIKKAKLAEQVEREKIRKRRTRALILFSSNLIRKLETQELKELIELVRDEMRAREGKQQLDYLPYLLSEIREQHPDFEFTETETEKEPETEEEAVAGKEDLKKQLQVKFEEAAKKAFQD